MNLKAVKGPISVVTSEMGLRPGSSTTTGECFVTVEQSHIRTLPLNTGSSHHRGIALSTCELTTGVLSEVACNYGKSK